MRQFAAVSTFALLLATAPLSAGPASVSMPSFWRYAHPEAKALIGVEWQRILRSPIGRQIEQKLAEQETSAFGGAQILNSVNRIFISSPGNPDGAGPGGQPPVVMALQGNFDLNQVRQMAAAKTASVSKYKTVEMLEYQPEGKEPTGLALVSPQLLLLGDVPSVEAAIDHYDNADASLAANPMYLRALEMAASNDLWIISEVSPSSFSNGAGGQAQILKQVKSIEAGLSLGSGLGLQLNLATDSSASATKLASGLQMMLGMMLSGQQQKPGMGNLADKLRVATDESRVTLALSLSQQELEQAFHQVQGTMTAQHSQTATAGRPAPEPEPQNQVIKIYGLDDGPREIRLGNP